MAVPADRVPETRDLPEANGGWKELRKLQVTGKSTYIVSLPKQWIREVGLHGGDTVLLRPHADGSLVLESTSSGLKKKGQRLTIEVDGRVPSEVVRQFLGAYLLGCRYVTIASGTRIPPELRRQLRRLPQSVIGIHVVDETDTSVSLQVLADTSDYSPARGIRRMHAIVRAMCEAGLDGVHVPGREPAEDLTAQGEEVNKIQWLIAKQCNLILSDSSNADRAGMTPQEALSYALVARSLARIADHACRIARFADKVSRFAPRESGAIPESDDLLRILDDAVTAFLQGEIEGTDRCIMRAEVLATKLQSLRQDAFDRSNSQEAAVSLAYVVDSLERITAYCIDVAETAINHHLALKLAREGDE